MIWGWEYVCKNCPVRRTLYHCRERWPRPAKAPILEEDERLQSSEGKTDAPRLEPLEPFHKGHFGQVTKCDQSTCRDSKRPASNCWKVRNFWARSGDINSIQMNLMEGLELFPPKVPWYSGFTFLQWLFQVWLRKDTPVPSAVVHKFLVLRPFCWLQTPLWAVVLLFFSVAHAQENRWLCTHPLLSCTIMWDSKVYFSSP